VADELRIGHLVQAEVVDEVLGEPAVDDKGGNHHVGRLDPGGSAKKTWKAVF